jgi:hypothetical protein
MFYWMKIYALISATIFAGAGIFLLGIMAWNELKSYAGARYRIHKRMTTILT